MLLKYGFLNFDEPKNQTEETPKKLFSYNVKNISDVRSAASSLSEDIYSNLNGKDKFRFYIENEHGAKSVYQVNLSKESRNFFELELADDLETLCN